MIKRLTTSFFLEESASWFVQFGRYLFVTGISVCCDFLILFALVHYLSIYYLYAACISFSAALVLSFILNIKWVFNSKKLTLWQLVIFSFIGASGMGLNAFLMWLFTSFLGVFYLISKIIATSITLFWNFNARKALLYPAIYE